MSGATFNRFDIAEAYWCYLHDWNVGGLTERDRAGHRSISTQLAAMRFKPRPNLSRDTLEPNGRLIYTALVRRHEIGGSA